MGNQINMLGREKVLILTPVKDAEHFLENYFKSLHQLTYPADLLSIGLLEGDSGDNTYAVLQNRLPGLQNRFRAATVLQKHFGFKIPSGLPRWTSHIQLERRSVLAKSRNYLLFRALDDEDRVLWLDVDVIEYPCDIIEQLLATGKDIVHPNCVKCYGGDSYDLNAWRERGKLHLHDLRREGDLVKLDAVGGTMLLVRADLHREGLVFPAFPYGRKNALIRKYNGLERGRYPGEIETEGLGMMAHDMGYECWGMPNLEIRHHDG